MIIALIGYRGTGKSTIAKIIAQKTGMKLENLDALIVESEGKPIPLIVDDKGWDHFRDVETRVLEEAINTDNLVLDCGGGIIIREKNREILKKSGQVFWLTADVPTIIERIGGDDQRPSLTGKSFTEEVEEVLTEREPLYKDCATQTVDTVKNTPEQAAAIIMEKAGV